MFEVATRRHFDAAHCLRGYQGKCERLHGHRFEVEAVVRAEELDATGIALDFTLLKRLLGAICDELDHRNLNELPPFQQENASSEGLARYIYRRLAPQIPEPARLLSVTVWESPESWARYSEP
ncbi:MAG: 6-carboxytetrahydropterin synthase QueD [Armatimonadetes bacterium]|jgi:6-pyruvoyltetrahydropterin/6-carboxytetrahydropterin synthase|nr:6-carboxytetrahydropterin synthase QueD [Armatimonadota bacterium]HOM83060.1 6-carboxytetrahydropterin synthase QueD [Armatimonadota bacterium]HPO72315.1 6-carboxytetrahydropterin synthase QueD [Armatimonadota bacterium]